MMKLMLFLFSWFEKLVLERRLAKLTYELVAAKYWQFSIRNSMSHLRLGSGGPRNISISVLEFNCFISSIISLFVLITNDGIDDL